MLVASAVAEYGESSARRFGSDTSGSEEGTDAPARDGSAVHLSIRDEGVARGVARARARRGARAGERRQGAGLHRHGRDARTPPRPTSPTAIKALGTANDFTVDVTGTASSINAPTSRATAPWSSSTPPATCSTPPQEAALQAYVEGGGGFVGIGESALLEQGGAAFFNTLTGLAGRPHHRHRRLEQRRRRVPRPRAPGDARSCRWCRRRMTETWYTWATNPTGTVHTVARVRGNALPDGTSITNDAVTPLHRRRPRPTSRSSTAPRPGAVTSSRAARSTPRSAARARAGPTPSVKKLALGAIQWASGMVRGGCKAGINSNYTATQAHAARTRPARTPTTWAR